jgi:hypothetical protein
MAPGSKTAACPRARQLAVSVSALCTLDASFHLVDTVVRFASADDARTIDSCSIPTCCDIQEPSQDGMRTSEVHCVPSARCT